MSGTDFEQITVQRDGDRDIRFVGKLLASAKGKTDDGGPIELELYTTKGGKFVCQRIKWWWTNNGRTFEYDAAVCDSKEHAIDFFEQSAVAKELYEDAGWDVVEEVA